MKGSEREEIQIALLKAKLAREAYELAEAQQATYLKLRDEMVAHYSTQVELLKAEMCKMRVELSPKFEGLEARRSFTIWDQRESAMLNSAADALQKRVGGKVEPDSRPKENVIQFHEGKAATG